MPDTDLQNLSSAEFKRLCGVSRDTFDQMVEVLHPHLERQGRRGGQNKLSVEAQLLVTLEYWREYRSQFHIATSWGLHETTVSRIIRLVEDVRRFVWQVSIASANVTCINLDGNGRFSWSM